MTHLDNQPGPAISLHDQRDELDRAENAGLRHMRRFWLVAEIFPWFVLAVCMGCVAWCYWMAGMLEISR